LKNIIIFIFLLLSLQSFGSEFQCKPKEEFIWKTISPGVKFAKFDVFYAPYLKEKSAWSSELSRSVTVRVLKVDLKENKLLFHRSETSLNCNPSSDRYIDVLIKDSKSPVIAAINASFFVMPSGGILGIAIDENKIWSNNLGNQEKLSSGVLGLKNEEFFLEIKDEFIEKYGSHISAEEAKKYNFAIQAYPILVNNSEIKVDDTVLNQKRSRTSIGLDANNHIILLTIDARAENDKTGMTLFEYAHFVKNLDCGVTQKMVLNLDGGGSTAIAVPSEKILEQADRCRNLGNILTIQKR
jgi:uncharacterized protein YigE (DUF2233 family)